MHHYYSLLDLLTSFRAEDQLLCSNFRNALIRAERYTGNKIILFILTLNFALFGHFSSDLTSV